MDEMMPSRRTDRKFMIQAIEEMRLSRSEHFNKADPLVGAVLVDRAGRVLARAPRGNFTAGDHAEFSVLEKFASHVDPAGLTLYTTLSLARLANLQRNLAQTESSTSAFDAYLWASRIQTQKSTDKASISSVVTRLRSRCSRPISRSKSSWKTTISSNPFHARHTSSRKHPPSQKRHGRLPPSTSVVRHTRKTAPYRPQTFRTCPARLWSNTGRPAASNRSSDQLHCGAAFSKPVSSRASLTASDWCQPLLA